MNFTSSSQLFEIETVIFHIFLVLVRPNFYRSHWYWGNKLQTFEKLPLIRFQIFRWKVSIVVKHFELRLNKKNVRFDFQLLSSNNGWLLLSVGYSFFFSLEALYFLLVKITKLIRASAQQQAKIARQAESLRDIITEHQQCSYIKLRFWPGRTDAFTNVGASKEGHDLKAGDPVCNTITKHPVVYLKYVRNEPDGVSDEDDFVPKRCSCAVPSPSSSFRCCPYICLG